MRLAAPAVAVLLTACLDTAGPVEVPECRRPEYDTTDWERVSTTFTGGASLSILLPPGFVPTTAPREWERGQLRITIREAVPGMDGNPPEQRVTIGGCTATIAGRTTVVDFAQRVGSTSAEQFLIATWRNIRSETRVIGIVLDGRTFDEADLAVIMAIVFSAQITESGPVDP